MSFYAGQGIPGKRFGQGVRQERQLFLLRLAGAGESSLGTKLFRLFFSEPAFSGKVLFFLSGLGFQPDLQKQRKRLGFFLLPRRIRMAVGFLPSGAGKFLDGKASLILDRKGMNLYTG